MIIRDEKINEKDLLTSVNKNALPLEIVNNPNYVDCFDVSIWDKTAHLIKSLVNVMQKNNNNLNKVRVIIFKLE